jgi:hypothetical protein
MGAGSPEVAVAVERARNQATNPSSRDYGEAKDHSQNQSDAITTGIYSRAQHGRQGASDARSATPADAKFAVGVGPGPGRCLVFVGAWGGRQVGDARLTMANRGLQRHRAPVRSQGSDTRLIPGSVLCECIARERHSQNGGGRYDFRHCQLHSFDEDGTFLAPTKCNRMRSKSVAFRWGKHHCHLVSVGMKR